MSRIYLLMLVLVTVFTLKAQDRIITVQNDTINCRIQSVTDSHIQYEQPIKGGFVKGKFIPLIEVAEYFRKPGKTITITKVDKPWVLGFSTGGGYLPLILETYDANRENEYSSKIINGFQLSTSVHYLFSPYFGAGLQYSFFTSGYKRDELTGVDQIYSNYANTFQRERHYINFGGLSVLFQQSIGPKKKIQLSETLSAGGLLFRYEYQFSRSISQSYGYSSILESGLIHGITLGVNLGLSVGYYILPNLMGGVGADFLYGTKKNAHYTYTNSSLDYTDRGQFVFGKPLNLSRLNYSLVLRYTL